MSYKQTKFSLINEKRLLDLRNITYQQECAAIFNYLDILTQLKNVARQAVMHADSYLNCLASLGAP